MVTDYLFGDFELRTELRRLICRGEQVALGARAFDLLIALIEHRSRVVGKDELLALVWHGVVVEENNLTVQISALRKVLGADAIVTVAGRGYRFGRALRAAPAVQAADADAPRFQYPLPDKPSVAVLPFLCMADDPRQVHFADGVSEDITTELSRFRSLFVIARNSAFTYKGRTVDARTVSRELGVRYVVEGSVRQSGRRVRVVAQLIDALSGEHVWAEKYDRVLEDIFDLQEDVVGAIVTAMAPQIDAAEDGRARRARPADLNAHGLAQRGWAIGSVGEMTYDRAPRDEALRWANEALAIDSHCVLALRTVALVHWWNAYHGTVESLPETLATGLAAADLAIRHDRIDHQARRWKGLLLALDRRPVEGLAELRQAHVINPKCALTQAWLAMYEALHGDPDKGVPHGQAALRLSPRDPSRGVCLCALGFAQFAIGAYSDAAQSAQAALAESPGTAVGLVLSAISWVGTGEIGRANTAFQTLRQVAPKLAEARLAGHWLSTSPGYVLRTHTFMRIAAGLEQPVAALALR